jgi:hypothetical protein
VQIFVAFLPIAYLVAPILLELVMALEETALPS